MIKMLLNSVALVFALSILSACATETNPNIESSQPTPSAPPTSQISSQQSSSSESTSSAVEPLKEEADAWEKQYKYISSISEGLIVVEDENKKCGAVDADGNIIIPLEYEYLSYFSNGTAWGKKDGKMGIINIHNEVVIPFEYDTFYPETERRTIVVKDHKWGVIDDSGNIVIPVEYSHVASFSDGWAVCYKGDKAGMVNIKNEVVIPFEYGYLSSFSEGLAVFQNEDCLYGYLDKNNQVIIPPIYQRVGPFVDGVAAAFPICEMVWLEDTPYTLQKECDYTIWQISYIDTKGNTLYRSDAILRDIGSTPFASSGTIYAMSGQWRIFDLSGYQAEDFNINGLYGMSKSGTYLQYGSESFWWGAFKGEPIYKVVDLQESTPYQDFSSAELLALYGQ